MLALLLSILQKRAWSITGQEGYWWGALGAAKGPNPQAKAYRLARFQDLQLHWLMPRAAAQLAAVRDADVEANTKTQPTGELSSVQQRLMPHADALFACLQVHK